jgi:hypothetical protein
MKQQIIITDNKDFSQDITGWGYIPKKGQVYRTEVNSFIVDYVITETDDREFVTTVFVKSFE